MLGILVIVMGTMIQWWESVASYLFLNTSMHDYDGLNSIIVRIYESLYAYKKVARQLASELGIQY